MFCVIQQIAHFCITNSLTETQSIYLQGQTKFNQPSSAEIGIFRDTYINTIAADASAPYVARPSATMILTLQDKPTLGFHEEISQIIAPSHCRQFIKMKMLLYFFSSEKFSGQRVTLWKPPTCIQGGSYLWSLICARTDCVVVMLCRLKSILIVKAHMLHPPVLVLYTISTSRSGVHHQRGPYICLTVWICRFIILRYISI